MKTLDYQCKFCGKPGVAKLPDGAIVDAEKWKTLIACDPCAKYNEERNEVIRRIRWIIGKTIQMGVTEELRAAMVRLTKKLSHLSAQFHQRPDIWEPQFAEMLLLNPDKTGTLLEHFERLAKQSQQYDLPTRQS